MLCRLSQALLQASGKVKRPRSRKKKQEERKGEGNGRDSVPGTRGGERKQGQEKKGEVMTSMPRSVIDEFFEVKSCQCNCFSPLPILEEYSLVFPCSLSGICVVTDKMLRERA